MDHLEKLKHFHKLYNFKSIKEASKIIGISQAGLSKSISTLEEVLGVALLVRNPRGIQFTAHGEKLYQFSNDLIKQTLTIQHQISKAPSHRSKLELILGTYDSIAVYFLPELFEYLNQIYPHLKLHIQIDHSLNIIDKMVKGKIDLAIATNIDLHSKNITHERLFNDSYGFFSNGKKNLLNINDLPIIFHSQAKDIKGKSCIEYLNPILKNREIVTSDNFETIKSLTVSGLGIGVMPHNVALPEIKQSRLVPVSVPHYPDRFGVHEIGLAYSHELMRKNPTILADIIRIGKTWQS